MSSISASSLSNTNALILSLAKAAVSTENTSNTDSATTTASSSTAASTTGVTTGTIVSSTQMSSDTLSGLLAAQEESSSTGTDASPDTDTSSSDIHSMTNAELVVYAQEHGLSDIVGSFCVDTIPADTSDSGWLNFYQSMMSDTTKHDFTSVFSEASKFQHETSSTDHFASMKNELLAASKKDAASSTF